MQEIKVQVVCNDGQMEIPAYQASENFAIHPYLMPGAGLEKPNYSSTLWAITHILTGYRITQSRSREDAAYSAGVLEDLEIDWSKERRLRTKKNERLLYDALWKLHKQGKVSHFTTVDFNDNVEEKDV